MTHDSSRAAADTARRPRTPAELRALVPVLESETYLNYGAHGPSPRPVVAAAQDFLASHEFDAPVSDDPYTAAFEAYDRVRRRIASFVGGDPSEVALTESTTAGINAVAGALDWDAGDVVVRTDLEHPAGSLPWQRLEREGVEVRVVETTDGRVDPDAFAAAVDGADLVCFSAVTWTHGTRLPVRRLVDIAHDAGAFTLVDAVQVPGQLPMDVHEWGADAVAAAGHKWLLGLWGGGFLYVDSAVADGLEPRTVGYRSVETPTADPFTFHPGARRFEVGSATPAPHVALAEALDIVTAVGVDDIAERIQTLTTDLVERLPADRLLSPVAPESGLVTVAVDDPEETVARLADEGITVRSLPSPQAVRASVHAVNTEREMRQFADALNEAW
jgi:selenocysteine lyase/cysteine desulfurase